MLRILRHYLEHVIINNYLQLFSLLFYVLLDAKSQKKKKEYILYNI